MRISHRGIKMLRSEINVVKTSMHLMLVIGKGPSHTVSHYKLLGCTLCIGHPGEGLTFCINSVQSEE